MISDTVISSYCLMIKTPCAEISIKEPPCYAEWAIAEPKNLHGLSKTRYCGLEKVTIQGLMTAAVHNIKRLLAYNQRENLKSFSTAIESLNFRALLWSRAQMAMGIKKNQVEQQPLYLIVPNRTF